MGDLKINIPRRGGKSLTNLNELNRLIEASGIKKQKIAEALGLSRQGLLNKLSGERPFQLAEIAPLCDLLRLTSEQRDKIFLS